ncbi:MAG: mandelate racemase/muconate lactonizing enzyme family protein [Candidatus Hydrogenedentes bacterium]|nr:mandelate racemase/muconate lactonizing enzyme family protein [Candidatus Hydrogenedentota bacterium]
MSKPTDVRPLDAFLYFLPVTTRVPLKFGPETLTSVTCARVRLRVGTSAGEFCGWGETPLSVQWVWPGALSYEERHEALKSLCVRLARAWSGFKCVGDAMQVGHAFQHDQLPRALAEANAERAGREPIPWLAGLVCCSAFDIALHDAWGVAAGRPVYEMYSPEFLNEDLSAYLEPRQTFAGKWPRDFLVFPRPNALPAWHLVGGKDLIFPTDEGERPKDGYPVLLEDWIQRDGLKCLKVKLRGDDAGWDYDRLVNVGQMGLGNGVEWFSTDFNCTVSDPRYVNEILDRLKREHRRIWDAILYVEQPFPYDLESNRIDVRSVSARKPLFMDESAHDWRLVRLGRELGWTGVALKTCKTQTGALLSLCWAKAHGMSLMVQDLTNPMLAQIPHVLLAAHAGTIMGVETNAMQFYPEASLPEARVHPGLYQRRNGQIRLDTVSGPGFGYRLQEIKRELPEIISI